MATKKDNLPLTLDQDNDSTGTITYANEVIAIIAGVAANEVEGVAGMCSGGGITDVFGRNKNITRGVKVELGTEEAARRYLSHHRIRHTHPDRGLQRSGKCAQGDRIHDRAACGARGCARAGRQL